MLSGVLSTPTWSILGPDPTNNTANRAGVSWWPGSRINFQSAFVDSSENKFFYIYGGTGYDRYGNLGIIVQLFFKK